MTSYDIDHHRPVNVAYLVIGLLFLGIAGVWALVTAGAVDSHQLGWLLPLMLVAAGAIGMVAVLARSANRRGRARRDAARREAQDAREVADLEAVAYAPYLRDEERTRVLDTELQRHEAQQSQDTDEENR